MTRLGHNRAISQLAHHLAVPVTAVRKLTIWGNHSSTQYPDVTHAQVQGKAASALVDEPWLRDAFSPSMPVAGPA